MSSIFIVAFKDLFMCVYIPRVWPPPRPEVLDPQELETQAGMSHMTWVLEQNSGSLEKE